MPQTGIMFSSTRGLAPFKEKKMSHHVNDANAENCYEEACEAAYAFFPEADWDTPAFDAWVNWKTDQLLEELPPCPYG